MLTVLRILQSIPNSSVVLQTNVELKEMVMLFRFSGF
jgi:hypothetical protein